MAVGYRGGLITGKIGGDVGYMVKNAKGRVSQGWRAYQAHVSNPNNYAQRYNRVILSTMARAYSVMRPICDHSFEGVSGASRNQKEFAKINMPILQERARTGNGAFNPKGFFAALVNNYCIAKGSLPRLDTQLSSASGSSRLLSVFLPGSVTTIDSVPTVGEFFDTMGWDDSGQITICWCETENDDEIKLFKYARYVFKLGETYNAGGSGIVLTRESKLYSPAEGAGVSNVELHYNLAESVGVSEISVTPVTGAGDNIVGFSLANIVNDDSGYELYSAAAINSALIGNSWKRSTQSMIAINDAVQAAEYEITAAIASYATTKDSSLYLNH